MEQIGTFGKQLQGVVWIALRTFISTVVVLTFSGIILAGLSWFFLREHHWIYGTIAVLVALVESVTTGIVLGTKRGMVMAMAHGLGKLRLGRSLVSLVFDRMLGVAGGSQLDERGGKIVQTVERLPLAQAEKLLGTAVQGVMGDMEQRGRLGRKIQTRVMEAIRTVTLARFRQEDTTTGGIDLSKVKEELERTVDDGLVRKVRGGLWLWTVLVIVLLPSVVAAQTWIIIMLIHSKG
jgi:hypothetical protein